MIVIRDPPSTAARMGTWRRQIGHRHTLAAERGPRPFAVVGYRIQGGLVEERYVPLPRLTVVALFDHRRHDGLLATRLVGVTAAVQPEGLRFGGVECSRFDKDLRLAPGRGRVGARLDAADGEFFDFALSLERYLERCARHPYMPRTRVPRLPTVETAVVDSTAWLVDITALPKRQLLHLTVPEHDLVGHFGTTAFDFVNTRFRAGR